jgi:DHA2 family methylenomycin A resistance protein-like MFS transporter
MRDRTSRAGTGVTQRSSAQRSSAQRSSALVVVVMSAGYFLVLLDVTIVNVALPRIGTDLNAGVETLQWVVDGYAVALASLLLTGGTVGDSRGHRRVVVAGFAVFGLASLACGLAPGAGVLVVARVVQGVGAALLLPGTLAVIAGTAPDAQARARAIGVWAGIGSLALPAGPLLGGALVETLGWRAVFVANVPVVLVALLLTVAVAPRTRVEPPRGVDRAGVLLGALLLATVTFALVEAGHHGLDASAVAAAGLAVLLVVVFVAVERRVADPMLPPGLFRRREFVAANLVGAVMNLGTLGLLFVLTLYLQAVQGRSAFGAGVAVLPLFVPLVVLAPAAGRVVARTGPRPVMVAGLLLAASGLVVTALLQAGDALLTAGLLLWGVGMALLTPAVVAAALCAVPPAMAGVASGINNTARQAGGAVGIAAFGALAGPADQVPGFLSGFHVAGLVAAGLYLAATLAALVCRPAAVG